MIDNILNTVKRSAERVQRRGEEVAQVARLKMEVFQLSRELDGHFARLGRSYHSGAEVDLLQSIREDIRRVEDEIKARERLIEELGEEPEEVGTTEVQAVHRAASQSGEEERDFQRPAVNHETPPTSPNTPGNRPPFTTEAERRD